MSEPALRFGEFKGEKTNLFTIEDIANIQVGRDLKVDSFSEVKTKEHSFPVYSNTVENNGFYGFYDFEEYKGNSLTVVGRGAGLGKAFPRTNGFGAIGRLLVITPKGNEFDVSYFSNYVNFKLQIHNESGGIPQLPGSTFGKYQVILPSLAEQTKIANFLTAVDEKITLLTQKSGLLAQYKKGVMQQIFSQELRFKDEDGRDFPEWEEKTLGETASFRRGSFPQPYGLPEWYDDENGSPFVQVFDVDSNMRLKEKTKNKISSLAEGYSVFVKSGTVLVTLQGSIGRVALTHYDAFVDRTLLIFTSYKLPVDKVFFSYVIYLLFEIEKVKAPGGIIKTITKEVLTDFVIWVPSLKEQTKIANFLTAIDNKITNTQAQLAAVKQYKQGLLQQMFV